ncbi:hypothetical protein FOA52_011963 [Chlamydomonas sp. UWO 241]|nr:hypothetical protein FOA52_011963 [Chlamydomonas sp. UWO 241]
MRPSAIQHQRGTFSAIATQRRSLVARAQGGPPTEPPPADDPRVTAVLDEMKKSGMTASKAKELLNGWTKQGVESPDELRKVLVQRSLAPLGGAALQSGIDAIVSYGGFTLASTVSESPGLGFLPKISLELLGNFAGIYYGVNSVLELLVVGAILFSAYKYGTSAPQVLAAVRQLAEPSGLSIVDKAKQVANTVQVLRTLDEVAGVLRQQFGELGTARGGKSADSLQNLSALLTLKTAEERGFSRKAFGLSERQATNIALAFCTYDTNDNGMLERSELGKLCDDLGQSERLSETDLKAAFETLDTDNSGFISFPEFVAWWAGRCPVDPKAAE